MYHVNQCRIQLGTNKVVVVVVDDDVVASIHYYSTETDITAWIIFYYSHQYFENVVRWGSCSFEFYLVVCVILLEYHSIRDVTLALRGLIEAKH